MICDCGFVGCKVNILNQGAKVMTEQQVKEFFQAVAKTDWNTDFNMFKARTGFTGSYAEDKWREWRELVEACTYFDEQTLMKIIGEAK